MDPSRLPTPPCSRPLRARLALAAWLGLALGAPACGEPAPEAGDTARPADAPGLPPQGSPPSVPTTVPMAAPLAAPADTGAGVPTPPPAAAAQLPPLVEQRSGLTSNGAFRVSWVPQPDPIPFNEPFELVVTIARAATPDVPEPSARLELDATMPAHGHGMNRTPRVEPRGDGTFLVEGMLFHMSGEWTLNVHVYVGSEYGQAILRTELP